VNKVQQLLLNKKRKFKPSNKKDMEIVKEFLRTDKWGPEGCPFVLEWPYLEMPYMLKTKITEFALK
jgi:hypothetical protein